MDLFSFFVVRMFWQSYRKTTHFLLSADGSEMTEAPTFPVACVCPRLCPPYTFQLPVGKPVARELVTLQQASNTAIHQLITAQSELLQVENERLTLEMVRLGDCTGAVLYGKKSVQ